MKTRILTVLTTLAFLGFSVSAFAGKDCVDGDTRPKCNSGGGGDDHGDPPAQYCAELREGGFQFGTQTVIRNNRGNSYSSSSAEGPELTRGASGTDVDAWDEVFVTCPATWDDEGTPQTVNVSADWSIDNSGGSSAGTPDSRVNLAFRNSWIPEYSAVEIDLFLVGRLPDYFPTEPDKYIDIELGEFWYYVHAHGNEDCKIQGSFILGDKSILRMTWGPCPTTTP